MKPTAVLIAAFLFGFSAWADGNYSITHEVVRSTSNPTNSCRSQMAEGQTTLQICVWRNSGNAEVHCFCENYPSGPEGEAAIMTKFRDIRRYLGHQQLTLTPEEEAEVFTANTILDLGHQLETYERRTRSYNRWW